MSNADGARFPRPRIPGFGRDLEDHRGVVPLGFLAQPPMSTCNRDIRFGDVSLVTYVKLAA